MKMLLHFMRKFIEKTKTEEGGMIGSIANINMDEVAYTEWSCICVGNSYGKTKHYDYDRTYWIPGLVATPKSPLPPPSCKNHKDWECIIVYVMLEETGAKETSEFIRKSGGLVTQEQLDEYREKQLQKTLKKD